MFRKLFLAYFALFVVGLAIFGFISAETAGARVLSDIERRVESDSEMLRSLVKISPAPAVLQETVQGLGQKINARLTVIGPDGAVLADSHATPSGMDNHNSRAEVIEARAKGRGLNTRYSDTVRYEMMYSAQLLDGDRPQGVVVRASFPLTRVTEEVHAVYQGMAIAFLVLSLAGAGVSFLLARVMTRPFRQIQAIAESVAAGDFSSKPPLGASDEMNSVAGAMNKMGEELSHRLATLKAETSKLETVISSMGEGIVAIDMTGRILHVNKAAHGLFSFSADPVGWIVWDVIRQPGLEKEITETLRTGTPSRTQIEIGARTVALSMSPIGGGQGAVLLARDATEEHRYDTLRKEFVANVSHELRTPLTLIKGFLETLKDGALNDPVKGPEFLGIMEKHVAQLTHLVHDLLDLARLENRPSLTRRVKMDPGLMISKVLDLMRPAAEKKNQSIDTEIAVDLPEIDGDPDYLQRVVSNLVDNAIKYTPEKGHITVTARAVEGAVAIEVKDDGVGIPPQDLPRVFERFYRVDKSRSREMGGTGLGLSIVKHIVQAHGGTVEATSEVGRGSTFRILLPI